ncbi:hypothetical protein Trydic_g1168 [Trypoxylus dichotomus]
MSTGRNSAAGSQSGDGVQEGKTSQGRLLQGQGDRQEQVGAYRGAAQDAKPHREEEGEYEEKREGTAEGVMKVDATERKSKRMKDGTFRDAPEEPAIWLAWRKLKERKHGATIVTDAEGVLHRLQRLEAKGKIAQEVHHIIWERMNREHCIRSAEDRCGRKESVRYGGLGSHGAMQQKADKGRGLG